jgi:hypothetical protein
MESATLKERSFITDDQPAAQLLHPLHGLQFNAFWRMSKTSCDFLRHEANRSLLLLQNQHSGVFTELFMNKRGFFEMHDIFLSLPLVSDWDLVLDALQVEQIKQGEDVRMNQEERHRRTRNASLHASLPFFARQEVERILRFALGDRVVVLSVVLTPPNAQRVSEALIDEIHPYSVARGEPSSWKITVGAVFDNEKALRKIERGPSSTSSKLSLTEREAQQKFRSFWGNLASLRRFKDGAIVEAVVWEVNEDNRAGSLFETISRCALSLHCPWLAGVEGDRIFSSQSALHFRSLQPRTIAKSLALSHNAVEALDELRSLVVNKVCNLPVKIDSLMAIDPALRGTSLCPSTQHPLLLYALQKENDSLNDKEVRSVLRPIMGEAMSLLVSPIIVIAKYESSNKWPLEAEAIENCKNAMLLKLRLELAKFDVGKFYITIFCRHFICFLLGFVDYA